MIIYKKLLFIIMSFINLLNVQAQQNKIVIEGRIEDSNQITIPYVSISVSSKNIGTTSTEEGGFYLSLKQSNVQDTLVVSSMGFKTYKIKIRDYIHQNIKIIVLKEDVNELEDVEIKNAEEYVYEALKQLKNTFIREYHQLDLVYRRTSVEQNVSKFFVEHYMSIVYKGPKSYVKYMQVNESRKSADYRIVKRNQSDHALVYMINLNPLKDQRALKNMNWKKRGDTTYDGEDVLILEGEKNNITVVLYIGFDTNNIYKVESTVGRCVYLYAKNSEGKLYLTYHKREYNGSQKISELYQKSLGLKKPYITNAYRHEAFVLGVIEDKNKFTAKGYDEYNKELGDIKLPYHPEFWSNLSLPPDTAFFKKIKSELESNYGIPLETQFELVN